MAESFLALSLEDRREVLVFGGRGQARGAARLNAEPGGPSR
jgi:hypothetical protein